MVDDPLEALAAVVVQARRVALPPKLLDLLGGMAEDEDVVVPDGLGDLDVRAVQRADGSRRR